MSKDPQNHAELLSEFPKNTAAEWRQAAEKLLKGAPFDKVMTKQTPEGIRLQPIFNRDVIEGLPATNTKPGFDGFLRGTQAAGYRAKPWEIAQEMPYGTPEEFNQAALADLMSGQTSLNILLDVATLSGLNPDAALVGQVSGCGLSLETLKDMQTAFKGIVPDAVSFHFRTGLAGIAIGGLFFTWLDYEGIDMKTVKGSLGMDPLAVLAASGKLPCAISALYDEQVILAKCCAAAAPGIVANGVSTMPYHQAGASSVQELGIGLATGDAYLSAMIDRGISVDDAAKQIRFTFSVGSNFFMEIAKLRAARVLWAKVVESFGGDAEAQKINVHARTGFYNKTEKDPFVNMLRTTTESLSAVIAGVDSLCVGNFDEVFRLPSEFSRRISRNTQIILQEECELTGVVDPAGGSWAVEWLTNQVAEKSWAFFQEIEGQGGIEAALQNEFIQKAIAKTASSNEHLLNQRRAGLEPHDNLARPPQAVSPGDLD
ncbi:MAG: acyl-CoA mutase large subunit family protein, partial [Verrucomicrobiota bacterium]